MAAFEDEPAPDDRRLILEGGDRLTPEDLSGRVADLGGRTRWFF